jgi:hypothetical protein
MLYKDLEKIKENGEYRAAIKRYGGTTFVVGIYLRLFWSIYRHLGSVVDSYTID